MYIRFIFLMLLLNVCYSCSFFSRDQQDDEVVKELIYLRIEGLVLIELLKDSDKTPRAEALHRALTAYYKTTEADFVQLYQTRQLDFSPSEQDEIVKRMELVVEQHNPCAGKECLLLIQKNIRKAIQAYTTIVRERKNDDVAYFSFLALPGLFNLQQELQYMLK